MSYVHRIIAAVLLCGLLSGCDSKKPEVAAPPAPPAPAAKPKASAPEAPISTLPKIGGPTLTPPSAPTLTTPSAPTLTTPSSPALTTPVSPLGLDVPKPAVVPAVSGAPNTSTRKIADDLTVVQAVIANVKGIKAADVDPTKKLADLKISNLDLADIREQIEGRLKITLPSAALEKASGSADQYGVVDKLTVQQLADVVNGIAAKP